MTVYIEKPAVNLREELASLRNQGGYQEQQFYFDGLVTNGTFDSDISGWTNSSTTGGTISWNASGYLDVNSDGVGVGHASQVVSTEVGKTYTVSYDVLLAVGGSVHFYVGTSLGGSQYYSDLSGVGSFSATFTATTTTAYISIREFTAGTSTIDNISVFETDGTDVIHTMPKGWKPKDVFEDGLLQREGAAHDYTVAYDGFDYYVKPTVAPSATTQTCVIGVKA